MGARPLGVPDGLTIPPSTLPGEYTVGVGPYDEASTIAPVTAGAGVGGEEIRLATIRVR
ncbi:MAG: hypothetical protein M3O34_07905 [Chloroflexota bacterium]|nr:hypothetical protein [Chloroflexota bacterium]